MTCRLTMWISLMPAMAACASAAEPGVTFPAQYRVTPMQWPDGDQSGEVGQRLLRLLSIQMTKGLRWIEQEQAATGLGGDRFVIRPTADQGVVRVYGLCQTVNLLYAAAILTRCGEPGETMAGTTREELERTAVMLVRAVVDSHPHGEGTNPHPEWWVGFWGMRLQYMFGVGAWLVWVSLDAQTQLRVARILEHDADAFLGKPAPARLRFDTQAESNAWNGGGMAVVACMLKHHPHQSAWADKAKELMLSAYATQSDVSSSRIVDGKPLNEWLTGPNALSDYTVENHGFIHPDYIAAASEMIRSAIAYRLAGEPVPEAATFNADKTLDVLMWMTLPAGHYLYAQGTDYCSRRIDSFFQACNVIPLKPDPLRGACFLRCLDSIEKVAAERPELPMSGWIGCPFEFGIFWGLTENYMMQRLFGCGGEPLPDEQIEQRLAGVRIFDEGMFAIHRTPRAISSFSWHASPKASRVMGLTLPLDRDALVYPMVGSIIGELQEAGGVAPDTPRQSQVRLHQAEAKEHSLSVLLELSRCGGKVTQRCAFVVLPDGISVYLEERTAQQAITLARATSGNIAIKDDVRWVYQSKPRRFAGQTGELAPSPSTLYRTNWLSVDDRQGYLMLGNGTVRLTKVAGQPGIWNRGGTLYDTCRMEYVQPLRGDSPESTPSRFDAGQRISTFALITLPNADADETRALADEISRAGWAADTAGCLAVRVRTYIAYANFSATRQRIAEVARTELGSKTCGWMVAGAPGSPKN